MAKILTLEKYSLGVGDRFAHQAQAQLRACMLAAEHGVEVIPVWNKSKREHLTIGSEPATARLAADQRSRSWAGKSLITSTPTISGSRRWTDLCPMRIFTPLMWRIGSVSRRLGQDHPELCLTVIPSWSEVFRFPASIAPSRPPLAQVESIAAKYLLAVQEAGKVYRHVVGLKGAGTFITEVSMDETDSPQTPSELLLILAALADEGIPVQTIAPKFTGRFNKGVDYVGDVAQFEQEFNEDLAVIAHAVKQYPLPDTLKLSVHSGSDKFSIYGPIRRALARFGAGLHLKTAGTTWLEEFIGLAEAGGKGLALAKEIYARALAHVDELCAPYATVIDIDRKRLPSASTVNGLEFGPVFSALRHDQSNPAFNPHLRQLLHVGYKIAASMGARYLDALEAAEEAVSRNVTENLYERHLKPLFVSEAKPGCRTARNPPPAMKFIHEDFLLQTRTARRLYHQLRRNRADPRLPLPPLAAGHRREPAVQEPVRDLAGRGSLQMARHALQRCRRALLHGRRPSPFEKFQAWAATVPHTLRNPLYHWTHLELKRYFGIDELLDEESAAPHLEEGERATGHAGVQRAGHPEKIQRQSALHDG